MKPRYEVRTWKTEMPVAWFASKMNADRFVAHDLPGATVHEIEDN